MAQQCPKCLSHSEHIFTFESSPKTGVQWVIERCPKCQYAGWPGNPLKYDEYLAARRNKEKEQDKRRDIRGDMGTGWFGL